MKAYVGIAIVVLALSGCAAPDHPKPQPAQPLNMTASTVSPVYRAEVRVINGKYVLFRQAPGSRALVRLLESPRMIDSAEVSPDGKFTTYISYEDIGPKLFVQNNFAGRRGSCALNNKNIKAIFSEDSRGLEVTSEGKSYQVPLDDSPFAQVVFTAQDLPVCATDS